MSLLSAHQRGKISGLEPLFFHPDGTAQLVVEVATPVRELPEAVSPAIPDSAREWMSAQVSYLRWTFLGEFAQEWSKQVRIGQLVKFEGIPLSRKSRQPDQEKGMTQFMTIKAMMLKGDENV